MAIMSVHYTSRTGYMRDDLPPTPGTHDVSKPKHAEALDLLKHCSVPAEPELYVLGSYEQRVTIHSQQIRALNLVYALKLVGKLDKAGLRVAVIGAGIGGMTAAIAVAKLQATVTVFERHSDLLHNLRGCHTRHLHPNIYDWPLPVASEPGTDLPFMNWQAASADAVASTLLKQWHELAVEPAVTVRAQVKVRVRERLSDGMRRVTVVSAPHQELKFDLVILAVGFGVENTVAPQPLRSYWRDDALHQPEIELRETRTHCLVSGNGDGGLIDVLRLRLDNFQQENLIRDLGLDQLDPVLTDTLRSIEESAAAVSDPARAIYERYADLPAPEKLDEALRLRLRADTQVTLNFEDWAITHQSSILHRFLVSRLLKIDSHTTAMPGRLHAVEGHEPNLTARILIDGQDLALRFNRVVVRHGPSSALQRDFPELHKVFAATLPSRNALDGTRRRLWPLGFFGPETPAQASEPAALEQPAAEHDIGAEQPGEAQPAQDVISLQAVQLRDELRAGGALALASKVSLLEAHEQRWLLLSVWKAALADDNALGGLKQLLDLRVADAATLEGMLTRVLMEAIFSNSPARIKAVLKLGTEFLTCARGEVLHSFFEALIVTVQRDQYGEVNVIMPALAAVHSAIPRSLHMRYFKMLLEQGRSQSFYGAPAARAALLDLPEDMAATVFAGLDHSWVTGLPEPEWYLLVEFLKSHRAQVPAELESRVRGYIETSWYDFIRASITPAED